MTDDDLRLVDRGVALLAEDGPAEPPADFSARIANAARAATPAPQPESFLDRWLTVARPAAGIAAVAAVALFSLAIMLGGSSTETANEQDPVVQVTASATQSPDLVRAVLAMEGPEK